VPRTGRPSRHSDAGLMVTFEPSRPVAVPQPETSDDDDLGSTGINPQEVAKIREQLGGYAPRIADQQSGQASADAAELRGKHSRHRDEPDTDSGDDRPERPRWRSLLVEIAIILVLAVIISSAMRALVFQMYEIPSGSMEKTVMAGDKVAAIKAMDYHRGDIIVFADPGGWLSSQGSTQTGPVRKVFETLGVLPTTSTQHLLKRLIGMPGDTVRCDAQGHIWVNGVQLDETYIYGSISNNLDTSRGTMTWQVTVPAGRVFVMGDNRGDSADSRWHFCDVSNDGEPQGMNAFVPESDIVGPAKAIVGPVNRIQILHLPQTFSSVSDPSSPAPTDPEIQLASPC
jgi:signal peptidase I